MQIHALVPGTRNFKYKVNENNLSVGNGIGHS
jgi:hypothetical protein